MFFGATSVADVVVAAVVVSPPARRMPGADESRHRHEAAMATIAFLA